MADFPDRWEQGRTGIERLLSEHRLSQVVPSLDQARIMLRQADGHMRDAKLPGITPSSAFTLIYDATRKSLAAVLEAQGLRPTSKGGHKVVLDAMLLQFEPPEQREFREFDWIRVLRNHNEYPGQSSPEVTQADVDQAFEAGQAIIARAKVLVEHMPPF